MHRYAAALLPLCLPAGAVSAGAGAIAAPAAVTVTRAAAMASITGDARYFTGAVHVDAMFQQVDLAVVKHDLDFQRGMALQELLDVRDDVQARKSDRRADA